MSAHNETALTGGRWVNVGGIRRWCPASQEPRLAKALDGVRERQREERMTVMTRRQRTVVGYIARTAAEFGVPTEVILEHTRISNYVNARHVVAWLLRRDDWTYPEIGAAMGRDHTTIIHAVKRVERRADLLEAALAIHDELNDWEAAS